MRLSHSAVDLAQHYWAAHLQGDEMAIDATVGNGKDTLKLAQLLPRGKVYGMDIQEVALARARLLLASHTNVDLLHQSHESLPPIHPSLIVYNLGYLPGGDKTLTTQSATTLLSLKKSVNILRPGGLITIVPYPGHPEGAIEQAEILSWATLLPPTDWTICHHTWPNRHLSPSLIIIKNMFTID